MHDYYTGLDMDSFRVTADFAVDGAAAGENLAAKFRPDVAGRLGMEAGQADHGAGEGQADGLGEGPTGERQRGRADVLGGRIGFASAPPRLP